MNTQEQAEARSRLEQEVKEMKTREDSGQKERAASLHEERMMTRGLKNVITAGDVLKELLPKWEAKAREMKEFFDKLNEHVLKLDPVYCVDHEDTQIPINMDRSRSESWIDREFSIVYDKCPKCHPEEKSTDLVNEKWKKMGIPSNLYSSTIENFDIDTEPKKRAVSKIYKQLEKSGGFIILRGTVGTGKTHLAVGVIKHFGDGILVTEADLVGELRETYSSNIGQDKMVSKYRNSQIPSCIISMSSMAMRSGSQFFKRGFIMLIKCSFFSMAAVRRFLPKFHFSSPAN